VCGRYTLAADAEELLEAFDVSSLEFDLVKRFNIAPSQLAPVVAQDRRGRRIGLLSWGLVPSWMEEPGSGFINARSESVLEKPSFKEAFRRRRCLVPADGFFEWKKEASGKVPYWFHPPGGGVVSFAGLWDSWSRPDQEPRHTFTILTTEANEDVRDVHDRMPVVIEAGDRDTWLERETSVGELTGMLQPASGGTFEAYAVSTRVNRASEDDAGLIERTGS
jgi:putative SOS response-associated peptidase YedK